MQNKKDVIYLKYIKKENGLFLRILTILNLVSVELFLLCNIQK